jgi:predicted DNA-binding protein YlxM (UPF0122 family)
MNEYVHEYCQITGTDPSQIINNNKKLSVVVVRNMFIYLTWMRRRGEINWEFKKSQLLDQIAEGFNMRRHSVHEKIQQVEAEMELYRGHKLLYDSIVKVLETKKAP